MGEAIARANSNVALAKYWGKRDEALNLPYTGSISVTMAGLTTTVRTAFRSDLAEDLVVTSGKRLEGAAAHQIAAFLDLVRGRVRSKTYAEVEMHSDFPIAAGLASSASTYAALALAATTALGLVLSPQELSILARRGSGSAARSVFGGFVEWLPGEAGDGSDSYAVQLAPPEHWDIGIVVAITDEGRKRVGSREGMSQAVKGSPFFPAWLASHDADLEAIRRGIMDRDLPLVGETAEHNCLKMHAVSLAARPPLVYWTPATVAVIHRVRELREAGLEAYCTIDAGPQVKILCPMAQRAAVAAAIEPVPGVHRLLRSAPGAGVELVDNL